MEIGNKDWKDPEKVAKDIEELCSQCESIGAEMAKRETINLIDGRIRRLDGLIKDREETIKDPKINSAFCQKFRQDIKVYEYTRTELRLIEMKLLAKEQKRGETEMTPKEALEAMCERCHKNIQSIPSKGYLPHRECPFRHITGDYCEEYDTLKKALGETKKPNTRRNKIMTKEEIREKIKVLEDNGTISEIFLSTIGFDYSWRIFDNEKELRCYRNHYYTVGVPKILRGYIDKGYMEREVEGDYSRFYVTKKGFAWLSKLLGIKVEEID